MTLSEARMTGERLTPLDVSFLFAAASSSLAEPHLNRAVLSVQGSPWLDKVGCVGHGL
jgi:hypothetical protein